MGAASAAHPAQRPRCRLSLRQWVALCNQNSFAFPLFHCLHPSARWGLSPAVPEGQGVQHRQHLKAEVHRVGTGGCFPVKTRNGKVTPKAELDFSDALHYFFYYLRNSKYLLG